MSENLKQERSKLSFNVRDLSLYIYENERNFDQMVDGLKKMGEDPILRNDPSTLGKNRIELFKIYAEKNLRFHELFNLTEGNCNPLRIHFGNQLPTSLSVFMFQPYVKHLGSDEQIKKWMPRIISMEVIGAYVQTELGHGSDVRSLETTATFDQETDEFVIHSPTLTSTKFWPGELGVVANHLICFAQLILNGERKGVYGFIVPIRDIETHQVLPGIEVGDVGEKVGFNTKDNGYCRFNNVRIPRENMLMKYTKVTKKGEFQRTGDERVGYAVMMEVRDLLSYSAWRALSHALTIAVRYSIVRTQFQTGDGNERRVMDYQLQQDKLIPLLAATFAIQAGSRKVSLMTQENIKSIHERQDFSMMKDLHATLCGTKAFYSYEADAGVNKARTSCGGHGYLSYSGFTNIWREFSPTVTYEGDNTIMALQVARYLVKCLQKLKKGTKLHENVSYLALLQDILSKQQCSVKKTEELDLNLVLRLLQINSAFLIYRTANTLMGASKEIGPKEAWDRKAGIKLFEAAQAHMSVYTYHAFMQRIESLIKSQNLKTVMQNLCLLYGVQKLIEQPLGLMQSEYLSTKQFTLIQDKKEELLEIIRPDVVGLVDAFGYPDNTLRSAIGTYDGNVYETLMKTVRENNDFNKVDWTETFEKYIKPLRYVKRPQPML